MNMQVSGCQNLGDEDKPRFSRSNWSTIKYRKRNKAALIDMRALITFVKLLELKEYGPWSDWN